VRRLFGFLEIGEELHGTLVKGAPALGQAQATRRAVEEPCIEVRLQLRDLPRDGGYRQVQPLRRAREAPGLDDLGKRGNGLEAVHGGTSYYCTLRNKLSSCFLFIPIPTNL